MIKIWNVLILGSGLIVIGQVGPLLGFGNDLAGSFYLAEEGTMMNG